MDNQVVLQMLDLIEKMELEKFSLRAMLDAASRNVSKRQIDSLLERAMNDPAARDNVHAKYLPLRSQIESDSSLEEVLQQFLQISPPTKDVN
jgi:hypothetical protein